LILLAEELLPFFEQALLAKSARMFVCLYNPKVFSVMADPKKKTSKTKKNMRKATWKRKAVVAAQKALSQGKSVLTGRSNSFVYPGNEEEEEE
jgi:large subunit ribosomal protein L32